MNRLTKRLNFSSVVAVLLTAAAMAAFLAFPARYTQSVREGISLWAVSVLPATFPFLFLTALFSRMKLFPRLSRAVAPVAGKLFRVSGAGGCAAFLAALSGYPVGARSVLDLYERRQIPQNECFRLACLCTTTGPMFLVGAVGYAMFGSAKAGWILLVSHFFAVWTVSFALRFTVKKQSFSLPVLPAAEGGDALYESLYGAVVSILCVGGSIALFYAFGQMIADLGAFAGIENPTVVAVLRGMLEMTTGCKLLARDITPRSLSLACFLVTFGGLCVIIQQIAYLSRAKIKTAPFLAVKLVQGLLSAAICYPLALLSGFS